MLAKYLLLVTNLRKMRYVEHSAHSREKRKTYRVLVRKPESKRPLVIPRHKWETILKWVLKRRM
jgi:hypothetical protein